MLKKILAVALLSFFITGCGENASTANQDAILRKGLTTKNFHAEYLETAKRNKFQTVLKGKDCRNEKEEDAFICAIDIGPEISLGTYAKADGGTIYQVQIGNFFKSEEDLIGQQPRFSEEMVNVVETIVPNIFRNKNGAIDEENKEMFTDLIIRGAKSRNKKHYLIFKNVKFTYLLATNQGFQVLLVEGA